MAIFEKGNDIQYAPKVGENITVVVTSMRKVEQNEFPERNLKGAASKGSKNYGYYYMLQLDDGKEMPVNAWSLYFAIQESGVDFGQPMNIYHAGTGKYEVSIVAPNGNISKIIPDAAKQEAWEE